VATLAVLLGAVAAPWSAGQVANPVFLDDSPTAEEALSQLRGLLSTGNLDEAARTVQRLLETEGDRLLADRQDPALFRSVRDAVHATLLDNPALLRRYRQREGPLARAMLEEGSDPFASAEAVERTRLLTRAGLEAALRVAQVRFERAQFDAALRTLAQLRRHPDIEEPALRRQAADLLARTLARQSRPWAVELLRELRQSDAAVETAARPALAVGVGAFAPTGPVDLRDMVAQPLRSARFVEAPSEAADGRGAGDEGRLGRARRDPGPLRSLHVFPVVLGDLVFVAAEGAVRAWDRFTLSPVWTWKGPESQSPSGFSPQRAPQPLTQDIASLAVYGDWVVAALAGGGGAPRMDGGDVVLALDALTGKLRWSWTLAQLHPDLAEAHVSGRPQIDQGVVVLTLRKEVRERRLLSAYLAGLDLATGRLLWLRLVGSAGSLPYSQQPLAGEDNLVSEGVVRRVDRLGVAAAYETVTGRPLWVRRIGVETTSRRVGLPWQTTTPVQEGHTLFALTPDRSRLLGLDAASGALLVEHDAGQLGSPLLLLGDGRGRLVLVGAERVVVVRARDALQEHPPAWTALTSEEGPFVARPVVAGGHVLAPVAAGVLEGSLEPAEAGQAPRLIRLDHSGNLLALPSQLLVADDEQLHSYLIWEAAQRMLVERMEANPADPSPAATYAELAHRAGRATLIPQAVEQAMRAIERAPLDERSLVARRRLFRSVLAMVQPERDAVRTAIALPGEVKRRLLDQLGQLASAPAERAAYLFAEAEDRASRGQAGLAVEALQQALLDPILRTATFELRQGRAVSAQLEAARRLRRIVQRQGPAVYAVFDAEARQALASTPREPAALEELALRYPVARASVEALFQAAQLRFDQGSRPTAIADLESAYDTAAALAQGEEDPLAAEAAGRLVRMLLEADRPGAALTLLEQLTAQRQRLTYQGQALPPSQLLAQAQLLASRLLRRPRLGELTSEAFSLEGWRLHRPLTRAPDAPTDALLLERDDQLALWTVRSGAPLRLWRTPLGEQTIAVRLDAALVTLLRRTSRGWTLEARSLQSGALQWASRPFARLFAASASQPGLTVDLGQGEVRPADEMLFAASGQRLFLADRLGRIAAFDARTGQTLWSAQPLSLLSDLAAGSEQLVLVGAPVGAGGDSTALALDPATGRVVREAALPLGRGRWVRLDAAERAIVGMRRGVASIDMRSGAVRWSRATVGASPVDGWVVGGRIVTLLDDGAFRLWRLLDGDGMAAPLEASAPENDRMLGASSVRVAQVVGDRILIATRGGLSLFDSQGALVGRNRNASDGPFLTAVVTADRAVTVALQAGPFRPRDEGRRFPVYAHDLESLALLQRRSLVLSTLPYDLEAIDGALVVATRQGVVFALAPAAGSDPD